jgi:hypothetical protein
MNGACARSRTSTYIAPLWLLSQHPDALLQLEPGVSVHPMYRKAASLTHPAYREACRELISAYGRAFRGHPAVIGWQLDNEIDAASMLRPDYNPSAEQAWTAWLAHRFGSVEAMNEGLGFRYWGWTAPSFKAVPQPRYTSTEGRSNLPALTYANMRFRRDVIAGFLKEQAGILREAGVTQPLLSNWMTNWATLADDSQAVEPPGLCRPQRLSGRPRPGGPIGARTCGSTTSRGPLTGAGATSSRNPHRSHGRHLSPRPVPVPRGISHVDAPDGRLRASGLIYWSGSRWHGGIGPLGQPHGLERASRSPISTGWWNSVPNSPNGEARFWKTRSRPERRFSRTRPARPPFRRRAYAIEQDAPGRGLRDVPPDRRRR